MLTVADDGYDVNVWTRTQGWMFQPRLLQMNLFTFPNEAAVNMPSRWDGVYFIHLFYKHAVPTGQRCTIFPVRQYVSGQNTIHESQAGVIMTGKTDQPARLSIMTL